MAMNENRRLMSALALFAVTAMVLLSCVSLASEESDAVAGTFTGGTNVSSPTNPYTEINCDISDLEVSFAFDTWEVYYVELGSYLKVTGFGPDYGRDYDTGHLVLTMVDGIWTGDEIRAYFYDTGRATLQTAEDYFVIFEVVCTNDTKVQSITVTGASSGTYTTGYRPDGPNYEKDLMIYTTPRYSADPAPTTSVRITQTSGFDVADLRHGISASGLVPYLHFTPIGIGTATFLIEATDGGGASTTLTVVVNEYVTGTLTFNANGGSGAPADMEDESYTGKFYYEIPQQEPVRSGYGFLGWAESRYATEPEYFYDGQNDLGWRYSTSSAASTLYAVWEQTVQTYTASLVYDANGGSGAPASQTSSITGTSPSGSKSFIVTDDVLVRDGCVCVGWALSSGAATAQYHAGDSVSVSYGSSLTLYAVWEQASITMTGSPNGFGVVGTSWSYAPTLSVDGCTLSVSGASWMVVSGDTVVGTPTSAGTFEITVTAQKAGYQSATQTFTVKVLSNLSFRSSPEGGAIIYAV